MAWRAARSLLTLQAQLRKGAPAAAPPATSPNEWGLLGDAAHDPTSDHTPHDFPGWGFQIVTAMDFPNRPDLGLDAHRVLDDIRRSHDPRAKYGISNGEIFSNHAVAGHEAWAWRPYDGSDQHYTHGHLSVVGDSRADGTQPWQTLGAPGGYGSAGATDGDEDEMGASWPAMAIEIDEPTSVPLVETEGGGADPRPQWFRICNDTGGRPGQSLAPDYALRIMYGDGAGGWAPVFDTALVKFRSGIRYSMQLKKGATVLTIARASINSGGTPIYVLPTPEGATPPYAGNLMFVIERGPVVKV